MSWNMCVQIMLNSQFFFSLNCLNKIYLITSILWCFFHVCRASRAIQPMK